jgi:hypothetical protein
MKFAALTATTLALATAGAAATPSFAHDYGYYDAAEACHAKKQESGTTGAVLGGLAGAFIGSSVAGHGSHAGGAVIGGLAGALIGNGVGRSSAKDSAPCEARDYGRIAYRGEHAYYDGYQRSSYHPYRYGDYDPYGY